METPEQLVNRLLLETYPNHAAVKDALVKGISDHTSKVVEEAYRAGVREAHNVKDITPFLATSQVAAHNIIEGERYGKSEYLKQSFITKNGSYLVEPLDGGLQITKSSHRGSDSICMTAVNNKTIKLI